jgi:hypothetical protein
MFDMVFPMIICISHMGTTIPEFSEKRESPFGGEAFIRKKDKNWAWELWATTLIKGHHGWCLWEFLWNTQVFLNFSF